MKTYLLAILSAAFIFVSNAAAAFGQTTANEVKLIGLKENVTVTRDARSIPYISAQNDADLYFVQGYVTASDRLWQMDLLRRVARGESAEIFGKTTLEEDKRWRRFGFVQVAEESLKYMDPELRSALENYARGVNAYIGSLDAKTLPIEFQILQYKPREWTPADTVMIGKILAEALSSTYQTDLLLAALQGIDRARLDDLNNAVTPYDVILFGKDSEKPAGNHAKKHTEGANKSDANVSLNHPGSESDANLLNSLLAAANYVLETRERSLRRVGLYAEELAASNNWVISGKRTADGKPILANDPHLRASAPGIWYLTHISTPEMRVSGVTFPGAPGIVLGHNEHIAWGGTNVGPDVQDVYRETFNEKGEYKTPDGWAMPTIRKEEIRYRANPLSPELSSETLEVTVTRNGPIVIERDGVRYALRWTAADPKNIDLNAFHSLNRAKDWNDLKRSLADYGGPMQNFIYADTSGNIGWYAAGKVPLRRKGDGSLPYDGSTSDGDWVGYIPFEELPNLYNPPAGFIMTANQRITGTDYKYPQLVRAFAPPWRARRLQDLLSKDTKATMDSTSAAQHDVMNIPLSMLAKEIVEMKAASAENLKVIGDWDGRMTPDSKAALLVNEIRMCAASKMSEAFKPIPASWIREGILHWAVAERSARWLPEGYKDHAGLLRTCSDGSDDVFEKRFGADRSKWVWGSVSVARFPHPLAQVPLIGAQFATPNVPIAGSGQTPNVASGGSMRLIASPGNWDATRLVIPLGQSGDPRSPFYKDQFEQWNTGAPAVFPFSAEAVRRSAVGKTVFSPGN